MHDLTTDQKQRRLEIVTDSNPAVIAFEDFSDCLHDLLDNIAGFETASEAEQMELINELWGQYHHGKDDHSSR